VTHALQRKSLSIVFGITVVYIVLFFTLSVLQYRSFHTGYDLAGVLQGLWALAFGKDQFNTFWGAHNWLNHAYVISLPVALLYRFVSSAYLLLLLQTVALAMGAPVVYHLAWEKTNNVRLSLALAMGYLAYPVLHFANLFDFHWDAFAPLFLLLTLYYANKSLPLTVLCAALSIACKENIALTTFAMGVYVALMVKDQKQRETKVVRRFSATGIAVCLLSLLWFLAIVGVLVPALSGGRATPHLAYWSAYGETPAALARFVFTHPLQTLRILLVEHDGLKYIFKISLILLFLPLLAPEVLLMALPSFVMRFLSTCEPHHTMYFHHSLVETPIVFYAAIVGARRLLHWSQRLSPHHLSAALLWCLIITSALLGPFRRRGNYQMGFARYAFNERSRALREVLQQIPAEANVSASHWLTPHLAHRRFVYMFPNPYQRSDWNGIPGEPDYGKYTVSVEPEAHLERGQAIEWVVIDKDSPAPARASTDQILTGLKQSGEFDVVRDDRFVLVLRRMQRAVTKPNG
jgi:uncharacterized membrane protein